VCGRQGASHLDVRQGTGGRGIGRKRFGERDFRSFGGSERGGDLAFFLRLAAGKREASVHGLFIAVTWEPGGLDIIW
jgi:hypothetical protein